MGNRAGATYRRGFPASSGLLAAWLLGLAMSGCNTTTVSVVTESSDTPPVLIVNIQDYVAGDVQVTDTRERDWLGGWHYTTTIRVLPGSKIVVMPTSRPASTCQAEPEPTTEPSTQPSTCPADEPTQESLRKVMRGNDPTKLALLPGSTPMSAGLNSRMAQRPASSR